MRVTFGRALVRRAHASHSSTAEGVDAAHACLSLMVCVPSHSVVQLKQTPLMYAVRNESAQSPAVVELLLKAEADVNAANDVSAWEGDGVFVPYVRSGW